jgi:hypothetical protein
LGTKFGNKQAKCCGLKEDKPKYQSEIQGSDQADWTDFSRLHIKKRSQSGGKRLAV